MGTALAVARADILCYYGNTDSQNNLLVEPEMWRAVDQVPVAGDHHRVSEDRASCSRLLRQLRIDRDVRPGPDRGGRRLLQQLGQTTGTFSALTF
jgi:hypothetical protein